MIFVLLHKLIFCFIIFFLRITVTLVFSSSHHLIFIYLMAHILLMIAEVSAQVGPLLDFL